MITLRIEHPVPSYEQWKKAFDSDPVGRKQSGVRRFRVLRPVGDAGFVTIDLDFETAQQADLLLGKLRQLWSRVDGKVMSNPRTTLLEVMEEREP